VFGVRAGLLRTQLVLWLGFYIEFGLRLRSKFGVKVIGIGCRLGLTAGL